MYQPPGMPQLSHQHLVKKQGINISPSCLFKTTLHSTSAKIKALEAKLKMMEEQNDQTDQSSTQNATSSVIQRTCKYIKPYHRPQHINR